MSLSLGYRPGHLTVNLVRGTQFIDTIELTDPLTGLPTPWPVGTTAWLRLYKPGTAFDVTWPALIMGALMSWDVLPALVDDVPKGSTAQLWLDYPDPGLLPFVWVTGHVSHEACGGSGFDTLLVIPPGFPGAGAIAVPVPGPQGPPGVGGSGAQVFNEDPGGVQNGVNLNFTLVSIPLAGSVRLCRNGLREMLGVGFTVSGSVVTFTTAPLVTDELIVDYQIA